MANYNTLKAAIQQVVKTNGNKEITGELLQQSLLAMVNSLGVGYQCMGVAVLTPTPTNPGTPDANVFYIASEPGTYANFDNIVINDGEVCLLTYNGAWSKRVTGAATASQLNQGLQSVVASLKKGYLFGGLVSPTDTYSPADAKVVFLASEEGTYPAFGNFSVGSEEIALFYWDTHWYKKTIPTAMGLKADKTYVDGDKMDVTAHAITALQSQIEALQLKIAEITSGQVVIPALMTDRLTSVSDNMHISGSGAPTVPPDYLYQEYIDTVAKVKYTAYGTTAVSDWKLN